MSNIDKIRQEIERLKGKLMYGSCSALIQVETNCKKEAYNEILSFINSLQQKQQEQQEEPDKRLKEAAEKAYPREVVYTPKSGSTIDLGVFLRKAFIAGARWQNHRELHWKSSEEQMNVLESL